jgi:YfiH family protein
LEFKEAWEKLGAEKKQVHGVGCVEIREAHQKAGEADAFYSRASGIPVSVVTADCVPVLLARKDGGAVAAVHAGWRGTRAHILRELWKKLSAQGERPGDWIAAIGPAIGPCCYEVSEELARDFAAEFSAVAGAVPRPRYLDLPSINAQELRAIGMADVDLLRACTLCSKNPEFFSYRRDGAGTRQWSIVLRTGV